MARDLKATLSEGRLCSSISKTKRSTLCCITDYLKPTAKLLSKLYLNNRTIDYYQGYQGINDNKPKLQPKQPSI